MRKGLREPENLLSALIDKLQVKVKECGDLGGSPFSQLASSALDLRELGGL